MEPSDQPAKQSVTDLLLRLGNGDRAAYDELLPHIYDRLREIARSQMRRERRDHTLQPTALVHEAFLRLVDTDRAKWESRTHFLHVGAKAMRCVLVDHARARVSQKRGGGIELLSLEDSPEPTWIPLLDLVALDAALSDLARSHPRPADVVELIHFGGMTVEETALALGISRRTATRDWRFARTWLQRALAPGSRSRARPTRDDRSADREHGATPD